MRHASYNYAHAFSCVMYCRNSVKWWMTLCVGTFQSKCIKRDKILYVAYLPFFLLITSLATCFSQVMLFYIVVITIAEKNILVCIYLQHIFVNCLLLCSIHT